MRKLKAGLAITLDGVVDGADDWVRQGEEMNEVIAAGMAESDAILIGRRTYLDYAGLWPNMESNLMSDFMNGSHKYVLSTTLTEPLDWANSELVAGELADVVAELKGQPGKNIQIPGSPTVVRALLRAGLLDELELMVHPIVLGSGARLFPDDSERLDLELAESKTFSTGVVYTAYRAQSE